MLKPIVAAIVLSSGTVLYVSWFEAAALAHEVPVCFMTQPTGEVLDLTETCLKRQKQPLQEQSLSVEKQVQALYEQATSLSQEGHLNEAVDKLTWVVNIKPRSPQGYVNRGNLRLEAGDIQGSLADLQNYTRVGAT